MFALHSPGRSRSDLYPLAGPFKILVAVGAPDEQYTGSAVLDQERELQNILDAVEPAQRSDNCEVRILEVGSPDAIGTALRSDAYHVLHISCHGLPGGLELEDEDGHAVPVDAEALLSPLKEVGRPLPLILLSSCHGGSQGGTASSLAEALLRAGVPAVLAMQTAVSDPYAAELAREFYARLAERERLLPGRALAGARRELEQKRLKAIQQGAPAEQTLPEYATAGLFVAGEDHPLLDFGLDRQPLRARPHMAAIAGPVRQLALGDLIGRRRELRETLRALRGKQFAGVALTGIGGVGKSAVAGRAMQRLAEEGRIVCAHRVRRFRSPWRSGSVWPWRSRIGPTIGATCLSPTNGWEVPIAPMATANRHGSPSGVRSPFGNVSPSQSPTVPTTRDMQLSLMQDIAEERDARQSAAKTNQHQEKVA